MYTMRTLVTVAHLALKLLSTVFGVVGFSVRAIYLNEIYFLIRTGHLSNSHWRCP